MIAAGSKRTVSLPPGEILAVAADAVSSGSVWPFAQRPGDTPGVHEIAAGSTVMLGPWPAQQSYLIEAAVGSLTYSMAPASFAEGGRTIPALSPPAGVVEMFGDDAPVAAAKAVLTTDLTGNNNDLEFTAVVFGERGNEISVEYVDPGVPSQALSVAVVNDRRIIVSLATGSGETGITSTAALIEAAIIASEEASKLVDVDDASDNNGSGVVTEMARTFLEDGAGTGVGVAGPGSRYTKLDDGVALYVNAGDADEPDWVELTQAS